MVKHWSQQISAAINREASRNITRKASQMVDNANATQRQASAAIDSGDEFSHKSIQAIDSYDNFDHTIMASEDSQSEDFLNLNRVAQCEMEPGPPIEEISPQFFTPLNVK